MNRPMYEHFAARHLAVKGPGALTQLEEGVMGTLPLDLSSDPSYWFIQGIRTFAAEQSVSAGGAGTYAKVGLSIESTSAEILVRILGIHILDPNSGQIQIHRCLRTAFSSGPGVYGTGTDTRIAEAQNSQAVIISAANASLPGTSMGRIERGGTQTLVFDYPMIISPGQSIYFLNTTTNDTLRICLVWVEIPAYKAEL